MLVSEAITRIKTRTSHDSDDQVSTAQFIEYIQSVQDDIRRKVSAAVPSLYTTTASTTLSGTVLGTGDTIALPATFLYLVRLEKQVGSGSPAHYFPVPPGDGLHTDGWENWGLSFREEATNLVISPIESAAGTYRLTYVTASSTLVDGTSTIEIPRGTEDILIEWCSARVRERCYEDPTMNQNRGDRLWAELLPVIKKRYGNHPQTGLRRVRGDRWRW